MSQLYERGFSRLKSQDDDDDDDDDDEEEEEEKWDWSSETAFVGTFVGPTPSGTQVSLTLSLSFSFLLSSLPRRSDEYSPLLLQGSRAVATSSILETSSRERAKLMLN